MTIHPTTARAPNDSAARSLPRSEDHSTLSEHDRLLNELIEMKGIVTEDDTPVDNMYTEKHRRLLPGSLYSSWAGPDPALGYGDKFLVASDVGIFYDLDTPPIVPDVFLSLGVRASNEWTYKVNRSYFIDKFGKPPDVVIEIVSNRKGHEMDTKMDVYAKIGVRYYIVHDPDHHLNEETLLVYELQAGSYVQRPDWWLPEVGLGVTMWDGEFEGETDTWLRWCDRDGRVIPTGAECAKRERWRAEIERQQRQIAEQQRQLAEQQRQRERQRAEQSDQRAALAEQQAERERQRVAQLQAQLRALGIDPETLGE